MDENRTGWVASLKELDHKKLSSVSMGSKDRDQEGGLESKTSGFSLLAHPHRNVGSCREERNGYTRYATEISAARAEAHA
jgi:hypothetical protein